MTKAHTTQEMLSTLGVPDALISLPLPYLWMLPGTTDPDTAGVVEIVRALQRGLFRLGFGNVVQTGTFDKATRDALAKVSPNWANKAWIQIVGDVVGKLRHPDLKARMAVGVMRGVGDYIEYEPGVTGPPLGPLPSVMVGTPPGPMGMGDTATDAGGTLTWSASGTACKPVPSGSGTTYNAFKDLQRQVNRRLSKVTGGGRITEDGIIGSGTLAAIQRLGFYYSSCGQVAAIANTLRAKFKAEADALGIPANANKSGSGSSSSSVATTAVPGAPVAAAVPTIGGMETLKKYAPFFLVAAGAAFFFAQKKKGRKAA